jgi:hypothetical protein
VSKRSARSASHFEVPVEAGPRLSQIERDGRTEEGDPSHHLWRNGRLWWISFTVHRGHIQERVRFSLATDDVEEARRRRDRIFAVYEEATKCRISIRLRRPADPRRKRGGGHPA